MLPDRPVGRCGGLQPAVDHHLGCGLSRERPARRGNHRRKLARLHYGGQQAGGGRRTEHRHRRAGCSEPLAGAERGRRAGWHLLQGRLQARGRHHLHRVLGGAGGLTYHHPRDSRHGGAAPGGCAVCEPPVRGHRGRRDPAADGPQGGRGDHRRSQEFCRLAASPPAGQRRRRRQQGLRDGRGQRHHGRLRRQGWRHHVRAAAVDGRPHRAAARDQPPVCGRASSGRDGQPGQQTESLE